MRSLTTGKTAFVLVCITLLLGVMVSPVAAQSSQPDWADDMYDEFDAVLPTYNANVGDAGMHDRWVLADKSVNFEVTDTDGQTATFSFETDRDLRIHDLRQGARDDIDLTMKTDRATMESILDSSDPARAFNDAVRERTITMHGEGAYGSVKYLFINALTQLASFFDRLF